MKRVDADNKWIEYTLTENTPADAAFTADDATISWTFNRSQPTSYTASFYNVLRGKLKIQKQQVDLTGTTFPPAKTFTVYRQDGEGYVSAGTMTTGADGTATSDYLDIAGADGTAITYYLVEAVDANYAVTYPSSVTIDLGGENVAAWPVTLHFQKLTDLSGTAVVNSQNKGKLKIVKTDADGSENLSGAKFLVYTKDEVDSPIYLNEGQPYVTDGNGLIEISPLNLGTTYYAEEIEAPDDYLLSAETVQHTALTSPLETGTLTFQNPKKPLLTISKALHDLTTHTDSSGAGITFNVYEKTGEDTFAELSPAVTLTTDASGNASAYLPDAGTYYLREQYPDGVIKPGVDDSLYTELTQDGEGQYYFGPYTLERDATGSYTLVNYLNRGKITVTKTDQKTGAALKDAVFTISVTLAEGDSETIAVLTDPALGFTEADGVYSRALSATDAGGIASMAGLPIYDQNGDALVYTVRETAAPSGYFASEEIKTASFATADDRVFEMSFTDMPRAALSAQKVWAEKYTSKGHEVRLPLPGATIELYEKTEGGGTVTLSYVGSTLSDENGWVSFNDLKGLSSYVLFERTPPPGYELPDGKDALVGEGSLANDYALADYEALFSEHNGLTEHDFATDSDNEHTYGSPLVNYLPYAQFRLLKYKEGTEELLNYAKYMLYSSEVTETEQSFEALKAAGLLTREDYTYETGTEYGETGSFITNPQTYGRVYWLVEVEAPDGYQQPEEGVDHVVGPLTPPGTEWGTNYVRDGLKTVPDTNVPLDPGSGLGSKRYMQIELNKILKTSDGTLVGNLPGVTFELWLANGNGEPVKKISRMITGLDMGTASSPSDVAGRAISESFDMAALYADPEFGQYVELVGDEAPYDYRANFVLVETAYPKDVTPVKTHWVLTATTNGSAYTVNADYTEENSIPNMQAQKVPVRVCKLGYNVATSASQHPLEGVVVGIYTPGNVLVASGETDAYGYVTFLLQPGTSYYAKEVTSVAGYEMNAGKFTFTTGTYGTTVEKIITDAEYRKMTILKSDANGQPVPNVTFEIKKSNGDPITDSNGQLLTPNTITTDSFGKASIMLPAGTYQALEKSLNGVDLSATEKSNFKLANSHWSALSLTTSGVAEFSFTFTNPARGALDIAKKDDAGATMSGVSFAVQFKAFTALGESAPAVSAFDDSNTDWLSLAGGATWTTGADGTIHKTGLLPGWYKLTETVPAGYVSAGVLPFVVKVDAKGLGQSDDTAATLSVTNRRKGYVTLTKTFADSIASWPEAVTFEIFTDREMKTPANPASVSVPTPGRTGFFTFAIDPNTYYIRERSDGWYNRYAVNSGALNWLDTSFEITVTSGNTAASPVLANVVNEPKTAAVTLKKVDDSASHGPVEGASFAIYYLDGSNGKVYLGSPVLTNGEGVASLTVTLPKARVILDQTDYYLEELSAPPQYKLIDPLPLTLIPGASLSYASDANLTIVDETALVLSLTKYGKTKENIGDDPAASALPGVAFELYKVDSAAKTGELLYTKTTNAAGAISFGNLPKLSGDEKYYLRESATPSSHVAGSLKLYDGETLLTAESIAVGGSLLLLYPVAQDEDTVTLKGYNTPKGSLAVLKYNYVAPTKSGAVPENAHFTVKNSQDVSVGTLIVGKYLPALPESLDGGAVTYTGGNYYKGSDGCYYSAAILENLEPGVYTVTETAAATGFLLPSGTSPSEPWHTVHTVTVGDNGQTAVAYFANLPNVSVNPMIDKSVVAVNGVPVTGAAQIEASLQKGEQRLTFQIKDIASTAGNLFMLPIEQLILKDDTLTFTGKNASGTTVPSQVNHAVNAVTVGGARYLNTSVAPVPTGDAAKVTAKVYGVTGGSATLIATVDVTGSAQTVTFPEGIYGGFQVVYTAAVDGAMLHPASRWIPSLSRCASRRTTRPAWCPLSPSPTRQTPR